ncbi:hypothetical protein JCM5353_002073, partial [Sporobolomyces roseus]
TVIVVPTVALQNDLYDRLRWANIRTMKGEIATKPSDVPLDMEAIVTVTNTAASLHFLQLVKDLAKSKRYGPLYYDEAHVYASDGHWRFETVTCGHLLSAGPSRVVFLTASLPPSMELRLLSNYDVPAAAVVRAPTSRPNFQFLPERIPDDQPYARLVSILQGLARSNEGVLDRSMHKKAIVFVAKTTQAETVASYLQQRNFLALAYHSKVEGGDRDAAPQDADVAREVYNLRLQEKQDGIKLMRQQQIETKAQFDRGEVTILVSTKAIQHGVDTKRVAIVVFL